MEMNLLEWIAALTGLLCVWFIVQENIGCHPLGLEWLEQSGLCLKLAGMHRRPDQRKRGYSLPGRLS